LRRAARIDANQSAVVGALRACGAKVRVVGQPLDLLVGFHKRLALFEVKDGNKRPSDRKLTPAQVDFIAEWGEFPIFIVENAESAVKALHLMGDAIPRQGA
jgi:hypothetical protein